ncbi:uncharacterized protein G2W53_010795 [Senna tora]|uniref:Retrotransposon Copia-like N-terminal domain-containing protein n=1 Tax=Senna tora TaxID=362788 RepID=A0A835CBS8_9FABA|nr:uncharacterized protein G2W53_010795 [Senna tora]
MHLPTGHVVDVLEIGSVLLRTGMEITNVLHYPTFKYNLLSEKHKTAELTLPTTVPNSGNNEESQGQDEKIDDQLNGQNNEATEEKEEVEFALPPNPPFVYVILSIKQIKSANQLKDDGEDSLRRWQIGDPDLNLMEKTILKTDEEQRKDEANQERGRPRKNDDQKNQERNRLEERPRKNEEQPRALLNSNQPGMFLVVSPLIGTNFLGQSTAIKTALEAKEKLGFIDGSIEEPKDKEKNITTISLDMPHT